jgi:hypothetical protein
MRHVDYLLPEFHGGSLSTAESAHVRAHLELCARCRAESEHLAIAMPYLKPDDDAVPPISYFSTILPRVRDRIDMPERRTRWSQPLIERVLLPVAVSLLLLFIVLSVPMDRLSPSSSHAVLGPIVQDCTQDELTQLEFDTQLNLTGLPSVQERIFEDQLTAAQAVPVAILKDAIADGELDDAVSGMVENLPDAELETVVHQLAERTVIRL